MGSTLVALVLDAYFHVVNVALVYLLAVVLVALRFRRGPVIAVSVLNVAAFNFFFIPPRGTFHVGRSPHEVPSSVSGRDPQISSMSSGRAFLLIP